MYFASAGGPMLGLLQPHVRYIKLTRPNSSIRYVLSLARLQWRLRPHIVHAHQQQVALLSNITRFLSSAKVVEHVHADLPMPNKRLTSYRSSTLIAVGSSVGRMLKTYYKRGRQDVRVLPNAVADAFSELAFARTRKSPAIRLLAIGRLVEQKDPVRFCQLVAGLLAAGVDCQARWVGDGPLLNEAKAEADGLAVASKIEFVGSDFNVGQHIEWADVLVVLSKWEGLPLVVLEGMSAGLPIIAHDVGSIGDVVDRSFGWLFEPNVTISTIVGEVAPTSGSRSDVADDDGFEAEV